MDDNNISPEELKVLTLAFMGQHLTGELKQLQSNIISQNPTCQGYNLNPAKVISTIPTQRRHPPTHTVVNAGINAAPVQPQINTAPPAPVFNNFSANSNQTELAEIITILKRIEQKLDSVKLS